MTTSSHTTLLCCHCQTPLPACKSTARAICHACVMDGRTFANAPGPRPAYDTDGNRIPEPELGLNLGDDLEIQRGAAAA